MQLCSSPPPSSVQEKHTQVSPPDESLPMLTDRTGLRKHSGGSGVSKGTKLMWKIFNYSRQVSVRRLRRLECSVLGYNLSDSDREGGINNYVIIPNRRETQYVNCQQIYSHLTGEI